MKIAAFGKFYFKSGWNKFDFSIVVLSLLDVFIEVVDGLSALRAYSLVSIQWPNNCIIIEKKERRKEKTANFGTFRQLCVKFSFLGNGQCTSSCGEHQLFRFGRCEVFIFNLRFELYEQVSL